MAYKLIDSTSKPCVSSALNFFETRPTNVAVIDSQVNELLTLNPVENPPYHFKIPASETFLDLSKSYLKTTFHLTKKDANGKFVDVQKDDKVTVCQALGSTFIKNIKIVINGNEIFNSNGLYSYKSIFDLELSCTKENKESYLQAYGYHEKEYDRKEMLIGKCDLISRIFADIFNQELYFMNHSDIDIELIPNDQSFMIKQDVAKEEYKIDITSLKLYVKSVKLLDSLNLDINTKLELTPARYAITKTELKSCFISEGRFDYVANIFQNQVPSRVIVGFVPTENFVGSLDTDPFVFNHSNIRHISLNVNGHMYPNVMYDLDFDNKQYVRPFHDLYENMGYANTESSLGINMKTFKLTKCFFAFNLTNNQEIDPCFDLIKNGTTTIQIRFKKSIGAGGITMVVYGEFPGLLCVDKNRIITSDVTVL